MKNNFGQSVGKGRLLIGVGLILLITGLLASIIWFLLRPCLYITSDKHVFYNQPVTTGKTFSTQFIHSVQKTPVLENFVVDVEHKEIILDSTKYKSFAVGLPFLKSDGAFQLNDGYFLMEHMDRHFPSITMRTGIGTKLTLFIDGEEIRFYEAIPDGTAIQFYIAPYYERFFN